eukprot:gene5285-8903_t
MGGGTDYDRDVISVNTSSKSQKNNSTFYSQNSNKVFERKTIHKSCDPKQYADEQITCYHANPIVLALDITGSMGDWAKVIYDKLPMFYGEIIKKEYLKDPSISFCGIGDARSDEAPLQVTEFGQGKQIDELISKIWLEGGGGGNGIESYELAAYFYARKCDIRTAELPFIFFTGDEGVYETVQVDRLKDEFEMFEKEDIPTKDMFAELKKKFKVFHLHMPYFDKEADAKNIKQWSSFVGPENVIIFENPKAVIDVMLGTIAITNKKRTLQQYIIDMENRQQTVERIKEVTKALSKLETFDNDLIDEVELVEEKIDTSFYAKAPNTLSKPEAINLPTFSMGLPKPKKTDKTFTYQKDNVTMNALLHSDGTFHTFSREQTEDSSYQSVSFGIFYAPNNLMLMHVLGYAVWDATEDEIRGTDEQPTFWTPTSSEQWKYSYKLTGKTIQVFHITPNKETLLTLTEK